MSDEENEDKDVILNNEWIEINSNLMMTHFKQRLIFFLNYSIIFLMPILSLIGIFPASDSILRLEYWAALFGGCIISIFTYRAVEDICPLIEYTKLQMMRVSHNIYGISLHSWISLIIESMILYYVSLICFPSIGSMVQLMFTQTIPQNEIYADLLILYIVELIRAALIIGSLLCTKTLRKQIISRNIEFDSFCKFYGIIDDNEDDDGMKDNDYKDHF